jgi:DNA-3-methyladenine glycosylase
MTTTINKLPRSFFEASTITVARNLIGAKLVWKQRELIITETEAYLGLDDEACHAAKGRTKRTEPMFGQPGCLYIYFIYGMYYCMNIVTECEGFPAAVLIRGAIDLTTGSHLNGPGKLCKYLAIDKSYNCLDIIDNPDIYLTTSRHELEIITTTRIGISKAQDKPWRFVAKPEEKAWTRLLLG